VVELSGGIYRLMTKEKECRLYRIMENARTSTGGPA
jgi:hypothetical protein